MSFTRILVPLDGSPHGDRALDQARRLLEGPQATLELLSVVRPLESTLERTGRGELVAQALPRRRDEARHHLEAARARLAGEGVESTVEAVLGDPAQMILERADPARGVELVAMATHGRGGLMRLVRGSVAERVLRGCRVPLLLVNPKAEGPVGPFRRVLWAHDGSERSAALLPLVQAVAGRNGAEVVLLRVGLVPTGEYAPADVSALLRPEELEATLEPARAALAAGGLAARSLVRFGYPATEILDAVAAEQCDLVALTTHGRSGLDRWLFGSVAEKVLRSCRAPLLVLRPPASAAD